MSENTWRVLVNDWRRRKFGDKYDAAYAGLYLKDDFGGRIARCVERMDLKPEDVLLDVGCGNGLLCGAVTGKVVRYVGYDNYLPMLEAAKKNFPDGDFHFGMDRIWYDGGGHYRDISVVAMFDLTEHIEDYKLRSLLDELKIITARTKKARLFIHTPNADYFMEKLKAWGVLPQLPGHIAVRNGLELAALLTRAGYHVTKIEHLPHYTPLLRWTHWLSSLPVVGKYFKARLWIEAYV